MPPPPPRPPAPPGPPPPPASGFAAPHSSVQRPPPVTADRSAVLQDIQKGARLKKVDRSQIRDRSSPLVANAGGSGVSSSAAPANESSNSRNQNNSRAENTSGSSTAPQMLGSLFAGGMPTLKRTGIRQYEQENPTDEPVKQPSKISPVENAVHKPKAFQAKNSSSHGAVPTTGEHSHNGHPSPVSPPKIAPPKPAKLQQPSQNLRPSSLMEIDGSSPANGSSALPVTNFKPVPTPKPSNLGGPANNHNHVVSGSATISAQRPHERKPISNMTMPPQRPKNPPPPLPTNPPPTRNISQTMPRQKQQRPSLPNEQMMKQDSPPPLPGRPPSFRTVNGESRPKNQPPPPPPPPPQFISPTNIIGNQLERDGSRSLVSNLQQQQQQQQRAPLPNRPPVIGIHHSGSMQSLPDANGSNHSNMRPPKRHDSLTTVAPEPPLTNNHRPVPKLAPSPPQLQVSKPSSLPRSSSINMMQEFESKFSFHGINELPRPSAFSGSKKTYPSAKSRSIRPTAPAPPVNVSAR